MAHDCPPTGASTNTKIGTAKRLGLPWNITSIKRKRAMINRREGEQFYLARAKFWEEEAAKTEDPKLREQWLKVAAGYRRLAEQD